eukprot:6184042-Pleurochrysis_carterae.AAC.4
MERHIAKRGRVKTRSGCSHTAAPRPALRDLLVKLACWQLLLDSRLPALSPLPGSANREYSLVAPCQQTDLADDPTQASPPTLTTWSRQPPPLTLSHNAHARIGRRAPLASTPPAA